MCIRDRCTTVEYDPDDALDWYNSGQPMPKAKTYEEWYDEQVARNGQGSVEVCLLYTSELSEALEEERNGNPDIWFACNESDNFICT